MTRDEAYGLLTKYTKHEALVHHGLAVEAVMRRFAKELGEDEDYWGMVGLLHDIDWDQWPEEHCKKAPELLKEINADDDFIHAVCSHGWGLCSDVEPTKQMEKVLYTIDELSGLVNATALMRPTHMEGMAVKSVKKKFKNKSFAAGVNRDVIQKGCEMIHMDFAEVTKLTIEGMNTVATEIGL